MKNTVVAILVLLLASVVTELSGQRGNNTQTLEQVRQRLDEVKERLELTPEQVEKIRPVLVDELQKLRSVRDDYNEGNQNRRARLKTARQLRRIQGDADDKLKKILSKNQMKDLKKIREEWRQQSRERN